MDDITRRSAETLARLGIGLPQLVPRHLGVQVRGPCHGRTSTRANYSL